MLTPAQVRQHLLKQPALATEIQTTERQQDTAEAAALLAYRLDCDPAAALAGWIRYLDPSSRTNGPTRITRNGGIRRIYTSSLDGSKRSMDARWPMPVCVAKWISEQHEILHQAESHVRARLAQAQQGGR